jgi:hypothetical protein
MIPMATKREAQQEQARHWLRIAAAEYPERVIPAADGGTWIREISQRTGVEQHVVERIARELQVWNVSAQDVRAAQQQAHGFSASTLEDE